MPCPSFFEITFIITKDPSAINETFFAFLVPGNPYCVHKPWQRRGSYIKLLHLTSVYRRFSSLQCRLQPILGRKDETRADCCVMTCFLSTLPRFSCSCPKNIGKWPGKFTLVTQTLSEELLSETELNLRMTLKFIKRTVI